MRVYFTFITLLLVVITFTFSEFLPTALADSAQAQEIAALPDYSGSTYKARIPDTLDLAQRCGLAARGMTSCVDPQQDYQQYFFVYFGRDPVYMLHGTSDGCTVKFIEALPFVRVASGNTLNPECEKAWINGILQQKYSPLNGRILGAAGLYYDLTGDVRFKNAGLKIIENAVASLKFKGDVAYWPRPGYVETADTFYNPPADYDSAIWFVDGLVRFYKHTGYKPALELAGKMTRAFFRTECFYNNNDGAFVDAPIMWPGVKNKQHFHLNALMRLSCVEYAIAADDKTILDWVIKSYEYGKAHGIAETGWFPEALSGSVNAVYNNCEMCAVADMTALALKLSLAGKADYWDDADRWIRNMLVEGQLTHVDWIPDYFKSPYCQAATAYDAEHRDPKYKGSSFAQYLLATKGKDVCIDNVAERNLGCFGGWVAFNDWFGGYGIGSTQTEGPGIMHCCTGNSSRTLYAAWYSILAYDNVQNRLRVNLALNRTSKYADVESSIPYRGRIDVHVKTALGLEIRIPGYVDLNSVSLTVGGQHKTIAFKNRYLQCGQIQKGQTVTVEFPLKTETRTVRVRYYEKEYAIEESYILRMKGNTVLDVFPRGKNCPLYADRDKYRSDKVHYSSVERFVCDKELAW